MANASGFLAKKELIEEGDLVIIYVGYGSLHAIEVKRGKWLNMKYGTLRHDYLIGRRYGCRVSATAGYVYALSPNPQLWTKTLPRRTQILYTPDCSLILNLLDVKPGSIVCESGTGSGSLSHNLAVAVAPNGHLYTHDIDAVRIEQAENEFKINGLSNVTTCVHQNVIEKGFVVKNACDGVFLDLPSPWLAIPFAKQSLNRERFGRIVSFSPCIEQVQKVCTVLHDEGFIQIETLECVPRKLKVVNTMESCLENFIRSGTIEKNSMQMNSKDRHKVVKKRKLSDELTELTSETDIAPSKFTLIPFPAIQPTHSGYLTSATLLPDY